MCFVRWHSALILFILLFTIAPALSTAASVSLVWDANSESAVSGYIVHYGPASGQYSNRLSIGNRTSHTVTGLQPGTWYFAITACDSFGTESIFSNEVSTKIDIAPAAGIDTIAAGGAGEVRTGGVGATTQDGYAKLEVKSGLSPYGTAVFSFKQNGVTVMETGVPASAPTTMARVFVDYRSGVSPIPGHPDSGSVDINTGIAVVNCGSTPAIITYKLHDLNGMLLSVGQGTMAANARFTALVSELSKVAPDLVIPPDFKDRIQFGLLEIISDQPLSVSGLRVTVNQRNEALLTTTPIADLNQPLGYEPIYFPQFADGGGYVTSLILLNTSDALETGAFQIMDDTGNPVTVYEAGGTLSSSFRYSIPSGGAFRFQSAGLSAAARTGWVRLIPDIARPSPVGLGVFSYNPESVLIWESGIPTQPASFHARIYLDLSEGHNTGLAIANLNSSKAWITGTVFEKDGITPAGNGGSRFWLTGDGHAARFADEIVSDLPAGFTGVLDLSADTPFSALTLRSLVNERGDYLMTAFPVADFNRPAPSPVVFPHIMDGGGYRTQFILLSAGGASKTALSLYGNDGSELILGN
jgi:hypothetical protein